MVEHEMGIGMGFRFATSLRRSGIGEVVVRGRTKCFVAFYSRKVIRL